MRLLPGVPALLGQRGVRGVMQPGMPFGRDLAGLGHAGIGDPAPAMQAGPLPLVFVINIAVAITADKAAAEPRMDTGADVHVPDIACPRPWSMPCLQTRLSTGY